jgi:cysteine desulfurase
VYHYITMFGKTKRIFLDYASTTPIDRRVVLAMKPYLSGRFHNASALYEEGVVARKAIDMARTRVARIIQSKPTEVIFTGSGTESNNLAIIGVTRQIVQDSLQKNPNFRPHIITTNIEHVSVLEPLKYLSNSGVNVTYIPVDSRGLIKDLEVKRALRPETILVSLILANNEIGTIQPVRQIGVALSEYKKVQNRISDRFPYLHTDASQAPNFLDVNINQLHADLMTLDGSKIYGPKGSGCLVVKSYVPIQPILYGGGHEMGVRPGTENTVGIVGFAEALSIASERRETESIHMHRLQKYFIDLLQEKIPVAKVNGDVEKRLPNNVNICIPKLNAEFAVIQLDRVGVCCAAMTACKNLSGEASSHVISALGSGCEKSSLRFTIGRNTKRKEITRAVFFLVEILRQQGIPTA